MGQNPFLSVRLVVVVRVGVPPLAASMRAVAARCAALRRFLRFAGFVAGFAAFGAAAGLLRFARMAASIFFVAAICAGVRLRFAGLLFAGFGFTVPA
jgi:hypothetical protein